MLLASLILASCLLVGLISILVYLSLASTDLKSMHETHKKLLQKLDLIANEKDLSYWIDDGTLLGAVREKDIIPWDDDADTSMTEQDSQKLLDMDLSQYGVEVSRCCNIPSATRLSSSLTPKCECDNKDEDLQLLKLHFPGEKDSVWVDIFPRRLEDGKYRFIGWPKKMWPKDWHSKDSLDGYHMYTLGDIRVRGPKDPISFLERTYGDWKTPKKTHSHTFSGLVENNTLFWIQISIIILLLMTIIIYSIISK